MDTAQWPQDDCGGGGGGGGGERAVKTIEEIVTSSCLEAPANLERKARPQKEEALHCPRCNSTNTKFCYYNNYSLTQPRYFCKTCRRYWTEGGSLRNIPVGGGSRKNKRSSSSSSSSSSLSNSSSKKLPDLVTPPISLSQSPNQNPNHDTKIREGDHDLNLAFPPTQGITSFSELIQVPGLNEGSNTKNPTTSQLSALELLNGVHSSRGLNSFMDMPVQDPNSVYAPGFAQDFKSTLNFSLDGLGSGYGNLQSVQETGGRMFFPFDIDVKQVSGTSEIEQNREQGDSTGYWSGMLGGGGGGSW